MVESQSLSVDQCAHVAPVIGVSTSKLFTAAADKAFEAEKYTEALTLYRIAQVSPSDLIGKLSLRWRNGRWMD